MSPVLFPVASMDAFPDMFSEVFFDMILDAFLPMNFIFTDMGRQIHVWFQLCSTHKPELTTYGKKKFDKDTSFIQNYPKLSKIISNYLKLISNSSTHIEHFAIYGKNAPKNPQKPSAHKSKYSTYGQIFYIF